MAAQSVAAETRSHSWLAGLRRITTSDRYIAEIDGLRFIAILGVVLYHVPIQFMLHDRSGSSFWPGFWGVISNGQRGVELFFVISGFILSMPFAMHLLLGERPVRLKAYFLRRVTRLEPPYILAILIRLPLLVFLMHKPLHDVLIHGAVTLAYLHSLAFGTPSMVNPPAWSLEVEIQFYCLAPLLAWSYFSLRPMWLRRVLGMVFVLAAGLLQMVYVAHFPSERFYLTILDYVQYFFAGFMLCDLYLEDWNRIPSHWVWDLVAAASWCWIFAVNGPWVHVLMPFFILVAYIGAFKGPLGRRFFRLSWVSVIGGMCYSLYLTHNLALTAAATLLNRALASHHAGYTETVGLAYLLSLPFTLAAGLALYIAVERPCMDKRWPQKLMQRLRGA